MADDVAVMYCGQVVEIAPKSVIFADSPKYSHPYNEGLMASIPRLTSDKGRLEVIQAPFLIRLICRKGASLPQGANTQLTFVGQMKYRWLKLKRDMK